MRRTWRRHEDHADLLGRCDDVQVGDDDAAVDDHHPRADTLLDDLLGKFAVAEAAHAHHRRTDHLIGLGGDRWQRLRLQRLRYRGIDVVLGEHRLRRTHLLECHQRSGSE